MREGGMADEGASHLPTVRWSTETMAPNITLSGEGGTATHVTSQWNAVGASHWFKEGVHEVEIATTCVDNISLFVGIVERGFWEEVEGAEEGEEVSAPV